MPHDIINHVTKHEWAHAIFDPFDGEVGLLVKYTREGLKRVVGAYYQPSPHPMRTKDHWLGIALGPKLLLGQELSGQDNRVKDTFQRLGANFKKVEEYMRNGFRLPQLTPRDSFTHCTSIAGA